jgi:hypothetical protein
VADATNLDHPHSVRTPQRINSEGVARVTENGRVEPAWHQTDKEKHAAGYRENVLKVKNSVLCWHVTACLWRYIMIPPHRHCLS